MLKIKNKRTSKIEIFLDIDKINEDTKTKSIKFDRIWSNFLDKKKALIDCFKNKKKDVKMCYFDVILMVKWVRIPLVRYVANKRFRATSSICINTCVQCLSRIIYLSNNIKFISLDHWYDWVLCELFVDYFRQ